VTLTLVYELELDVLKMYLNIKVNLLGQGLQMLEYYRQTDMSEIITMPLSQ